MSFNFSREIPLTNNFNKNPDDIDSLRLIMTGQDLTGQQEDENTCDIILNKNNKIVTPDFMSWFYGNPYIPLNGGTDTGEEYCIEIALNLGTSLYSCTVYSTRSITFSGSSGDGGVV